jgi:hypothetical protein
VTWRNRYLPSADSTALRRSEKEFKFPGAVIEENESVDVEPPNGWVHSQKLHRELVSWFSVPERG